METQRRPRVLRLLDLCSGIPLLFIPLAPLRVWEGGCTYDLDIWWWTNIARVPWFWGVRDLPWHAVSVGLIMFLVGVGLRNMMRRPSLVAEWVVVCILVVRTFWAAGLRIYQDAYYARTAGFGGGSFMRSLFDSHTDLPVLLTAVGIGAVLMAGFWALRLRNRQQGGRVLRFALLGWTILGFLRPGAAERFWALSWTVERRILLGALLAAVFMAAAMMVDDRVADESGTW